MEPLNVPAGQQTIYNLTLQNPKEAVNYNNIRIKLESLCEVDAKGDGI
jgi:hypothetical protein